MTKKNLIYSLLFPLLAVIRGILYCVTLFLKLGDVFYIRLIVPEILIAFGGLLSIYLTIKHKIDTSQYFKTRLKFFALSLVTFTALLQYFYHVFIYADGCFLCDAVGDYIVILFILFVASPIILLLAEICCYTKLYLHKTPMTFAVILLPNISAGNILILYLTLAMLFTL